MLIEEKNIKKGDLFDVAETKASILLSPTSLGWLHRRKKKEEFNVSEKSEDLEWKILSSYLSGCLSARFFRSDGKEFSADQVTTANNVIQMLRGIESTIDQRELEFVDVVDYENVNPYDDVRRMFRVLRAMLQQNRTLLRAFKLLNVVCDSLHRHWTFEKEQVNPISFYIHRVVNVQLQFPDLLIKAMKNPMDCQHIAMITYILERIGDVIFGMAESITQIYVPGIVAENLLAYPPPYIENQITSMNESLKNLLDIIEKPMKYFLTKNVELSEMLEDSEDVVYSKNAKKGLTLRNSLQTWRTEFDHEIAEVAKEMEDVFLFRSIFPVAFRLRELSTYIESLSSRTCQLYYYVQ